MPSESPRIRRAHGYWWRCRVVFRERTRPLFNGVTIVMCDYAKRLRSSLLELSSRRRGGDGMARVGQTIEHPLTGEKLTFLETAATTGGDHLKASLEMAPGGFL